MMTCSVLRKLGRPEAHSTAHGLWAAVSRCPVCGMLRSGLVRKLYGRPHRDHSERTRWKVSRRGAET